MDPFIKWCIAGLLLAWATFVVGGLGVIWIKIRQARAAKR